MMFEKVRLGPAARNFWPAGGAKWERDKAVPEGGFSEGDPEIKIHEPCGFQYGTWPCATPPRLIRPRSTKARGPWKITNERKSNEQAQIIIHGVLPDHARIYSKVIYLTIKVRIDSSPSLLVISQQQMPRLKPRASSENEGRGYLKRNGTIPDLMKQLAARLIEQRTQTPTSGAWIAPRIERVVSQKRAAAGIPRANAFPREDKRGSRFIHSRWTVSAC